MTGKSPLLIMRFVLVVLSEDMLANAEDIKIGYATTTTSSADNQHGTFPRVPL